jgi:hypothetical protein
MRGHQLAPVPRVVFPTRGPLVWPPRKCRRGSTRSDATPRVPAGQWPRPGGSVRTRQSGPRIGSGGDRSGWGITRREVLPWGSGPHNPANAIEHLPDSAPRAPPARRPTWQRRQDWLQNEPCLIRETHRETVLSQSLWGSSHGRDSFRKFPTHPGPS